MTKTSKSPNPPVSRRSFLKRAGATLSTAALMESVRVAFPYGVARRRGAGPEVTKAMLGFIALTDAGAAVRRQGEGLLRQARHARRRGRQAGVLGHDARQPRARLRSATASTAPTS